MNLLQHFKNQSKQTDKDDTEDQTIFSFLQQDSQHKSYRIINKRTGQALTQGPQVSCRILSNTSIKQLWTLQKFKDDFSSIVSFGSGLALTKSTTQNLNCQKSKHKQNQMWKIEFAYEDESLQIKYFWIIPKNNQEETIFGTVNEPLLRLLKFDRTLSTSLWTIEEVDQNDKNFGFCEIRCFNSNLVLQAADTTGKEETALIVSRQQGKGAQKWIIQKLFNNFVIRNLCSGLVMSVGDEVKDNLQIFSILGYHSKNCRKIIQEIFENSNNQKWNLIKINQNEFYFQSAIDTDKFLGSLSVKEKEPVYLLGHQNFGEEMKNILWKVKGALPQAALKQKMLDFSLNIKKD